MEFSKLYLSTKMSKIISEFSNELFQRNLGMVHVRLFDRFKYVLRRYPKQLGVRYLLSLCEIPFSLDFKVVHLLCLFCWGKTFQSRPKIWVREIVCLFVYNMVCAQLQAKARAEGKVCDFNQTLLDEGSE